MIKCQVFYLMLMSGFCCAFVCSVTAACSHLPNLFLIIDGRWRPVCPCLDPIVHSATHHTWYIIVRIYNYQSTKQIHKMYLIMAQNQLWI